MSVLFSLVMFLSIAVTPPGEQYSATQTDYLLRLSGWPDHLIDEAMSVVWCESRRIPSRIGDNGDSVGLFQIQWTPQTWRGWKHADGMEKLQHLNISNPIVNSSAALVIYRDYGGWSAWTCKP